MQSHRLAISGMSCNHCIGAVRSALDALPDVKAAEVLIGSALVVSDGSDATLARVRQAIEEAGYTLTTMVPVSE